MIAFFEFVKEALKDQLRSPFYRSIAFVYVAINWKAWFYLFFADMPVSVRLRFFELNTDIQSLFWWPITGGLILAVASPWLVLLGAAFAEVPSRLLAELQEKTASEQRKRHNRRAEGEIESISALKVAEVQANAKVAAAEEQAKIDTALRREQLDEISDDVRREDVVADLEREQSIRLQADEPELRTNLAVLKLMSETEVQFLVDPHTALNNLEETKVEQFIDDLSQAIGKPISRMRAGIELGDAIRRLLDEGFAMSKDGDWDTSVTSHWTIVKPNSQGYSLIDDV